MKKTEIRIYYYRITNGFKPLVTSSYSMGKYDTLYNKASGEYRIHIITLFSNDEPPTLRDPFTVVHEGEVIFTLTDPWWIAKVTEKLLKQK